MSRPPTGRNSEITRLESSFSKVPALFFLEFFGVAPHSHSFAKSYKKKEFYWGGSNQRGNSTGRTADHFIEGFLIRRLNNSFRSQVITDPGRALHRLMIASFVSTTTERLTDRSEWRMNSFSLSQNSEAWNSPWNGGIMKNGGPSCA